MKYAIFLFLVLTIKSLLAQTQIGKASFYSNALEGNPTANGEKYQANKLTAAHKTLPFGTVVKVTNLANHQSVRVTINDRGPFVEGRIIDLSKKAAEKLKMINQGTTDVKIEIEGGVMEKTQPLTVAPVAVEEKEFYDFEISKIHPIGFGVQLGTYQELANLLRISSNLKKRKTVVQVKVVNGMKYYRLILGPFSSSTKAQRCVNELKKQFPDAFVLDYAKP